MAGNVAVPLYQQVKEDIKAAIEQGKYKPKEKIPTEPELSAEYSVSRITVRRAVEELCSEGYLVKMQGRGTFVSSPRVHRKVREGKQIQGFTQCCEEQGMKAGAKLLNRMIVPARADEQAFFGLVPDGLLLYIQRLRTADGLPVLLENIFLPYMEYRELMEAELTDCSIFGAIERIGGRKVEALARRTLEITRASAEEARLLAVPAGEPLFYLNAYFTDREQRPVCIGRQYYVGSRYLFEI